MENDVFIYKIYVVFFVVTVFFILLMKFRHINKRQTVIFLGTILVLGLSFRGLDQGLNDTRVVYMSIFDAVENMSYTDLITSNLSKYTSVLFTCFTKLVSDCTFHNFRCYIVICALLFIAPFELFIYKKCKDVYLANLLLLSFIYPYGFYIIRQCLSIGMLLMFLCYCEEKNKRKTAVIFAALSMLLHPLSGIFYVIYVLMLLAKKIDKLLIVNNALAVAILVILVLPKTFEFVFSYIPQESKYGIFILQDHYLSGELWVGAFVIYLLLTMIGYIKYFRAKNDKENLFLIGMSLCTLLFITTTNIMQDLVRIAYFFFPMNMIVLSNNDTYRMMKMRNIIKLMVVVSVIIYCFGIILPQSNIIRW